MSSPFVAEIRVFAFNFAPTGWAFCNGQLLPISQNTALFSLLGTNYGGDGKSTFQLPDLQGRAPMHAGYGSNGSPHELGEASGSESVTLLQSEIPSHTHTLQDSSEDGTQGTLASGVSLSNSVGGQLYRANPSADSVTMAPQSVGIVGEDLPHNNMQPYLTLNFCIALQGIFPPRG